MSFLFETVAIPIWFLLLLLASAAPIYIKLYKKFHNKYVKTGVLQEKLDDVKDATEVKMEVLRKASKNIQAKASAKANEIKEQRKEKVDRTNEKKVLKSLAEKGDSGMLLRSIADALNVGSNEATHSLEYLEGKKLVESVNGINGVKYYLTQMGKSYCIKKGYIS